MMIMLLSAPRDEDNDDDDDGDCDGEKDGSLSSQVLVVS